MTNHFYSPYLANAFAWGHAGIDFFFQLSGFIMLYVHWDQAGQVRRAWRFVVLRVIRIYPIYWCVLAVTIVMFWLHPPPPENMWAPVTTLQPRTIVNSALLRDPNHTIVAPAWTLTYEVMFYLFFALYFVVGAVRVRAAVAGLARCDRRAMARDRLLARIPCSCG